MCLALVQSLRAGSVNMYWYWHSKCWSCSKAGELGTITSQCQDAEGLGGSPGTGGSLGVSGQDLSHHPSQEQRRQGAAGDSPSPGHLAPPWGQGWAKRAGTLAHWWGSASGLVRGTRVRCSPRMSKAIEVVQGSQRDGKILFLYQLFCKPHSYFLFSLCSFQFIILVCRYLLQGNNEEVLFPSLTGTVLLLSSVGWLRKDLPSGNLSRTSELLNVCQVNTRQVLPRNAFC